MWGESCFPLAPSVEGWAQLLRLKCALNVNKKWWSESGLTAIKIAWFILASSMGWSVLSASLHPTLSLSGELQIHFLLFPDSHFSPASSACVDSSETTSPALTDTTYTHATHSRAEGNGEKIARSHWVKTHGLGKLVHFSLIKQWASLGSIQKYFYFVKLHNALTIFEISQLIFGAQKLYTSF